MTGKLYGVGVGPGDPELITLKAKRVLEEVDYIAVPKTASNRRSFAFSIVEGLVGSGKNIVELVFPMSYSEDVLESSWEKALSGIREILDRGHDVAFITIGDPGVYSTYMYVHKTVKALGYDTEMVPGITSFCASAARAGISLGENREAIAVVPSAYECENLDEILEGFDSIVLMKVSANFGELRDLLCQKGLADKAVIVSKCGTGEENVETDIKKVDGKGLSYFTTMIIKKN